MFACARNGGAILSQSFTQPSEKNVSVGICLDVCICAHKTSGTVQVGTNKAKSQGYRYPWMLQYFLYV